MKPTLYRRSKSRLIAALVAGVALTAALSGCVVYPVGPGYYHHYRYYDRDWR